MAYVKLHHSILDSSVWCESYSTRLVWIALLAMADQDGLVRARAPGITSRAKVTRAECDRALECFRSPDPDSATPDHEGRRILDTPEGILVLNYELHRDRMSAAEQAEKHAARQARYRDRKRKERDGKTSARDGGVTVRDGALRDVTKVMLSDQIISDTDQITSSQRESAGARETWATVLTKLRTIHGSDRYDPSSYREALEWIADKPPDELAAVLEHYAADEWAMKNPGRSHPNHIRKHWDKYLDGETKHVPRAGAKSGPGAATPYEDFKAEPLGRF